jgi:hypothetical protein
MHRHRIIALLFVLLALPLSASQFVDLPFEQVAAESDYIVRGTIGETWSAWDESHEVIFTYATVRVNRYFGGTKGPEVLVVREVGGTVDGYTQEAVGFPAIRRGEDVVLMLAQWEDSAEFRIHAFNQGKFLVRGRAGEEVLVPDLIRQGDARPERGRGFEARTEAIESEAVPGLRLEEFAAMVRDARSIGRERDVQRISE